MESVQCIKKISCEYSFVEIKLRNIINRHSTRHNTTQNCDIGNNRAGAAIVEASHPSLDVSSPVQKGALSSMTAGS